MTGYVLVVVLILAGLVVVGVLVDELKAREHRRDVDRYAAESHARLMSEIGRQP